MRVDKTQVVLATIITMQAPTVYQYQHIRVAQTIHLQSATHIVLAEIERCRQSRQDILDTLAGILLQLPATDHFGLHGRIFQQVLRTSTCHHHLLQTISTPNVRLGIYTNSKQTQAYCQLLL